MCQRKIIGKGVFRIVPVTPGGCMCPTITQIRDVDVQPITAAEYMAEAAPPTPPKPEENLKHTCRDIKTDFKMHEYPVTFRFCNCPGEEGCRNLSRTVLSSNRMLAAPEEECWSEDANGVYFEGLYENVL